MSIASTTPGVKESAASTPDPLAPLAPISPWPTRTAEVSLAGAIARLKAGIGDDLDDARVHALGSTAAARVEKDAPGAPQAVKDEAVIRYAGYLAESSFGGVRDETAGPFSTSYQVNHAAAFRLSGAYGLIAPWKVRRATRPA